MPIYVATNEIEIQDAIVIDSMEELTGADIMVSALKLPPSNEVLVKKQIESGAVLIQRKSGTDLTSSFGYRLDSAIARMTSIPGVAPYQCLLLFSGVIGVSSTGNAIINGRHTETLYSSILGALDAWIMRGGTVITVNGDEFIPDYLTLKEKKVREMFGQPVKEFYPPPLQELRLVSDWRVSMATFPLIGAVRANKIRDFLIENRLGDSLIQALVVTTNPIYAGKDSMGQAVVSACRSWLGLPDGWNIDIKPTEEG